jgi:hypothetical protein
MLGICLIYNMPKTKKTDTNKNFVMFFMYALSKTSRNVKPTRQIPWCQIKMLAAEKGVPVPILNFKCV